MLPVSTEKERQEKEIRLFKKADGAIYAEGPEEGPKLERFPTGIQLPLEELAGELLMSVKVRPRGLSKLDAKEANRVFAFFSTAVASTSLTTWFFPRR